MHDHTIHLYRIFFHHTQAPDGAGMHGSYKTRDSGLPASAMIGIVEAAAQMNRAFMAISGGLCSIIMKPNNDNINIPFFFNCLHESVFTIITKNVSIFYTNLHFEWWIAIRHPVTTFEHLREKVGKKRIECTHVLTQKHRKSLVHANNYCKQYRRREKGRCILK